MPEKNGSDRQKLREALRLIDDVRRTLNGKRKRCLCCGLLVYEDLKAGHRKERMAGIVGRIQREIEDC